MNIRSLIDEPGKLPTIPKVGERLMASFGSEDISLREIAHHLAADPGLSAKLLTLANSAYFHVSRTIGTVETALQVLGLVMVRNLVLAHSVGQAFKATPGMPLPLFWRYNLYTACAARWLAQQCGFSPERVFTLALLHGVGQLQLHVLAPKAVAPLDAVMHVLDADRAQLERESWGFHYGDVSAELAQAWNFPQPLAQALRYVPTPLETAEVFEAAGLVHLGAWRARVEVLGLGAQQQLASYPARVADRLHLSPDWMAPAAGLQMVAHEARRMPPLPLLTEGLEGLFE